MLLSRVAWQLYWSGRYLQRAQATARTINAALLISSHAGPGKDGDLLLRFIDVLETDARPAAAGKHADIQECIRFLVADRSFGNSLAASTEATRNNLRALRGNVSDEAWRYATVLARTAGALARGGARTQQAQSAEFVRACLALTGVFHTSMRRDRAFWFWQVGRQLEAADMTCRQVAALMHAVPEAGESTALDNQQWAQTLKSLGMRESYRSWTREPVSPLPAAAFVMAEPSAPGSVVAFLERLRAAGGHLPSNRKVLVACKQARAAARAAANGSRQKRLREIDRLLAILRRASAAISSAYFHNL